MLGISAEILEKGRFLEGGKPGEQRIVRLDQALAIVKPVPEFWIDFKDGPRFQPEQADKVVAAFAAAGIDLSRVMVATFSSAALKDFQARYPQVRRVAHYAVKTKVNVDQVFSYADELGLYGLNMPVLRRQTSVQDVAALKKRGLWVSLWFVQDAETAVCYGESNADAFVTDHVSIVRETLGLGQ